MRMFILDSFFPVVKHHPRTAVFIALLMLMLCVAPAMGEKVTPNTDLTLNESELKLSTDLLSLTNSSILQNGTYQTGLVSDLQIKPASQSVKQRGLNAGVQANSEIVSVYVTLDQHTPLSTVDPFVWEVSNRDESSRTVVAWVEVSRLLALASVPGVRQVRPVLPPVVNTGSVMTEGDRIHLADQVRATYGLTGAGVKIGIISDGVDHWNTAAATGDLPTNLHVLRNGRGGDEGTAMLEIVHDIAPDADLYFRDCGSNTLDFADGIDALADAGCTVICDDISWINDPFFEDGALATHIQSLTSTRNILYFSSAGNSAQRHYQGMYHKDGTTNWTDFSGGSAQADRSLYVSIPPGGPLRTVLEWDDPWTGSTNDYDLYLLTRGGEYLLARSTVVQNGDDAPLELISVMNTGSSTVETEIDVLNKNGAAADRTLEIFMYPGGGTRISSNNIVAADSIFGHAAAPNVVAVGAIRASDPGVNTIEYFSSLGPATIRYPGTVQRSKPDITGIDGVSVTGSGGFPSPFYGTSASAPDVAAVTALVWSGARTRTASEVRTALLSSSDDLGSAGPDNTFGYGRANAVAFTQALGIAPAITAGFYAFGHVGQAPYPVRFLDQSTGSPTAWHWDFGDGTTSDEQNPTHIYNQTGAYTVALTASNDQRSDTAIQYRCVIVNTVPAANFTANATAGKAPFTVQFADQSTGASGYQWQFGDGTTSTEQNPVHTYTHPGTYTVTLVASGADYGSVYMQKPGYITVTDPPTVGFSTNVTAGLTPLAVQFNESVNGSVQYYYWQFGDGATSFDRNPVHVYSEAGKYTVSLYAIGSKGTQVKTVEDCINVTDPVIPTVTPAPTEQYPPAANFTVTQQGGPGSMGILVADTSANATSVRYDLGDGTTTAYRTFRYTYWQAGTYTITQTATGAAGSTSTTRPVTVPAV